jgi:SAM-dependent methyltransferase
MGQPSDETKMIEAQKKLEQLRRLQAVVSLGRYTTDDLEDANRIAEELLQLTRDTYNSLAGVYAARRQNNPHAIDLAAWDDLVALARKRFRPSMRCPLRILDTGTAYGRDIRYASHLPNVQVIGIDIAEVFIEMLEELERDRQIPSGSFRKCDMRDLSCFPHESFEVVRHNASMVHLPVISENYMADLALQESRRVLRPRGLMHVSVKEGVGLQYIDTNEGMGKMMYQLHTMDSISSLLERNGFSILSKQRRPSSRGPHIQWLSIISER